MGLNKEIILEFPSFITHIPQSKKVWIKIGYNKIHASINHHVRNALVGAMSNYIERNIPENLKITGPVKSHLQVFVPKNYGSMKMITDKTTGIKKTSWKPPAEDYKPNWDIGNLAMVWLKSLDDVIIKKGILPDDTIEFFQGATYEYVEIENFYERKLIYTLKTVEKNEL